MKLHGFLLILCLPLCLSSCQKKAAKKNQPTEARAVLPPGTGTVSELVVVITDELWENEVGTILKSAFQENIPAIPQQEALFDLYAIEPKDFSSIFKTHKNILWLSTGDKASVERKDQKWAKNQIYVHMVHETEEQLAQSLQDHVYKIRAWFLDKDQQRRLEKLKPSAEKKIQKQLNEAYGINITIPKGYQVAAAEENFIWLRKDNPKVNIISNIWIHTEAYYHAEQFSKKRLIDLRDSLGRVHVEGARPQSYMATEMIYEPDYKLIKESPYTIETKGLWTMVNDFLGGSYLAYAILDEENQKIIYAEGFLYCPSERKRSHILELEAVLSSIKLK
jgi:hypothetical protein